MFPYFYVFGRTIGSYGVCAMVGLLVCGVVASLLAKTIGVAYEDIILMMVVIGISLVVGGHVLYGITNIPKLFALFRNAADYQIRDFFGELVQCFGGMVYYGGFLGASAGLFFYTGCSKEVQRKTAFDLFAVCIPLFHVFGRIGCFLSGCCYGIECRFGFVTKGNELIPELNDVRRLPVSLFEAGCNLVIFLVLLRLFLKEKERGRMIWYYMLSYPVIRFGLEFFRGDAIRGFLFGLSTSQWISIGLFFVAVWKLFLSKKGKKKEVACAILVSALLIGEGNVTGTAYAATVPVQTTVSEEAGEEKAQEGAVNAETEETEANTDTEENETMTEITGTPSTQAEEPPFNAKEKFVVFVCCFFSVALCLVIGIWGNPNDRLKDRYKRERRRQLLEQKKRMEKEKREAKFAEEDARYAREQAEYEAELKAKAEAKAAKKAEKAARKK